MDKANSKIKSMDKKNRTKSKAILDEEGKILLDSNEIAYRWKK